MYIYAYIYIQQDTVPTNRQQLTAVSLTDLQGTATDCFLPPANLFKNKWLSSVFPLTTLLEWDNNSCKTGGPLKIFQTLKTEEFFIFAHSSLAKIGTCKLKYIQDHSFSACDKDWKLKSKQCLAVHTYIHVYTILENLSICMYI